MADFEQIIYPQGGLNMDASPDTLPEGDYLYALNIIDGEYQTTGKLSNREGESEVVLSLPAGTNKVLGFTEDKEQIAGYYAVYNSNGDHCIVRYYPVTGVIEFVLDSESALNFQEDSYLTMGTIGSGNDKLLFWTGDQVNPPRKLNIARAYIYTNPTTTTTTSTT